MKNLHLFLSLQERRQLCMDARTTFEVGRDVALRAVDDGETVERLAQAMASSHPDPFQPGTVVRFLEEIFFWGGVEPRAMPDGLIQHFFWDLYCSEVVLFWVASNIKKMNKYINITLQPSDFSAPKLPFL